MKFHFWTPNTSKNKIEEAGSSMIEISGCLALIALLLMGALNGLQWSSDKLKSNLLKNDVLQRGTDIKNQMDRFKKTISLRKWDTIGKAGYEIDKEYGTIGIQVYAVPKRVCQMTFDDLISLVEIKVNEVIYALPHPQICSNLNTMVFYFDEDKTNARGTNTCDPECTKGKVCIRGKCVCPKGTTKQGDQCIKECDECYELDKESGTCQPVVSTGECCTYHGFWWEDGACKTHCDEGERVCSLGSSKWCCAEGRYCGTFEGQCCIGETCCPNHQNPYCANGTYDTTCTTEQCCTGKLTRLSDGTDICCPAGQTGYCSTYNEDGTCSAYGCAENEVYCNTTYNDGTCKTQTPCPDGTVAVKSNGNEGCCSSKEEHSYCKTHKWDKSCTESACCSYPLQQFEGLYYCCNSGEPYCSERHVLSGFCTGEIKCCSEGTHPYCKSYWSTGYCWEEKCCEYELKKIEGLDACCSPEKIPYCSERLEDGKCGAISCCAGNTKTIAGLETCCTSGDPYCNYYDENGNCLNSGCCSGTVSQVNGMDACCSSADQTPYCSYYNSDGTCQSASCCSGTVSQVNGMDVCCSSGQTPYCSYYNSDGTCSSASCCSGTVSQIDGRDVCCSSEDGVPFYQDGSPACCSSPRQLAEIDGAVACCAKTDTPYCYIRSSNNTCEYVNCCSSGKVVHTIYNKGVCCNETETPYCSHSSSLGCVIVSCCAGKVGHINGADICCVSGTPSCSSYNEDGTCVSATCCSGTVFQTDGKDTCCASGSTAYCASYNVQDGSCTSMACCAGTPYCYNYTTDGKCIQQGCCSGTQKPYCNLYNEDTGECMEQTCCADTVTKDEHGRDVCEVPVEE